MSPSVPQQQRFVPAQIPQQPNAQNILGDTVVTNVWVGKICPLVEDYIIKQLLDVSIFPSFSNNKFLSIL
jgi:hypothetical protein